MVCPVRRAEYTKYSAQCPHASYCPTGQDLDGFIVCQIEVQRGDGHMPAVDGMKIGAGFVIEVRLLAADPVILAAARVGLVDDLADEGTHPLAGDQGRL